MKKAFFVLLFAALTSCEQPLRFGETRVNGVAVQQRGFIPHYQTPPKVHYGAVASKVTALPKSVVGVQTPKGYGLWVKPTGSGMPVLPPGYKASKLPICMVCERKFGDHRWDSKRGWVCKYPPQTKVSLRRH